MGGNPNYNPTITITSSSITFRMPQLRLSSGCRLEPPTHRLPQNRSQWRFRPLRAPTEWIEEYRPGGYHPVELGDVFVNKYRVVRKLGYGAYSTVWLAHDSSWVMRISCMFVTLILPKLWALCCLEDPEGVLRPFARAGHPSSPCATGH